MSAKVIPINPEANAILDAALAYAAAGLRVVPVDPIDKIPLIRRWQRDATTDPEQIRRWFRAHPSARLGIVGGAASGVVFVDLDTKGQDRQTGKRIDGVANWRDHVAGQSVPETVTVRTPSGGQHLWFGMQDGDDYRNSASKIAPGVDVRAEGGFVLVPPSGGYEFVRPWKPGTELPTLPDGVLARVSQGENEDFVHIDIGPDHAYEQFLDILDRLRRVRSGERDNAVARAAMDAADMVYDGHVDKTTAKRLLITAALAMPKPLRLWQVKKCVESGFRHVEQHRGVCNDEDLMLSGTWATERALGQTPLMTASELIFNGPPVRALWGAPDVPLWVAGESLMLAGEVGSGKTTLAEQLVKARLGLVDNVLDYPVVDDGGRVLYLALDRPSQIIRTMRRIFTPEDDLSRLTIKRGPLPVRLDTPDGRWWMREVALRADATTVVLDSLGVVVGDTSNGEKAGDYNAARMALVADEGINLIEVHHLRKPQGGQVTGRLDEVYGSRWITSGVGSAFTLMFPDAEDETTLLMKHVKFPAGKLPTVRLRLDGEAGMFYRAKEEETLEGLITNALLTAEGPLTPQQIAAEVGADDEVAQHRVRNALQTMVRRGHATRPRRGLYAN